MPYVAPAQRNLTLEEKRERLNASMRLALSIAERTAASRSLVRAFYEAHPPPPFVLPGSGAEAGADAAADDPGGSGNRQPISADQVARIKALRSAKPAMTLVQIAAMAGCSTTTVRRYTGA